MDEIVKQIAEATGIDPSTAEKALGMMLGFLEKEGDETIVQQVIAKIPGADGLISEHAGNGGGFLGGLMGGGIMGLGQQLMPRSRHGRNHRAGQADHCARPPICRRRTRRPAGRLGSGPGAVCLNLE